jgi:hypothetical protein
MDGSIRIFCNVFREKGINVRLKRVESIMESSVNFALASCIVG